jgi:hypothetical protein
MAQRSRSPIYAVPAMRGATDRASVEVLHFERLISAGCPTNAYATQ